VLWSFDGGTWRRPGPRRRGRLRFAGISDGSIVSPGRTIGASVEAMVVDGCVLGCLVDVGDNSMLNFSSALCSLGGLGFFKVGSGLAGSGGRVSRRPKFYFLEGRSGPTNNLPSCSDNFAVSKSKHLQSRSSAYSYRCISNCRLLHPS
jgi:hypothetical protein